METMATGVAYAGTYFLSDNRDYRAGFALNNTALPTADQRDDPAFTAAQRQLLFMPCLKYTLFNREKTPPWFDNNESSTSYSKWYLLVYNRQGMTFDLCVPKHVYYII